MKTNRRSSGLVMAWGVRIVSGAVGAAEWRIVRGVAAACLLTAIQAARAGSQTELVIGQSFNLGVTSDGTSQLIDGAVKSYLARVNASGGVNGQKVRLISMNDEGDPKRHAENLRTLARDHGAVAFLNCPDDASCVAAVAVTQELHVPMVGAMGGSPRLARKGAPWMFRIRPDYALESAALGKHLRAMAVSRVALVTDAPESDLAVAIASGLARESIEHRVVVIQKQPESAQSLLATLEKNEFPAAVLVLSLGTIEWLIANKFTEGPQWPRVIAATSSTNQAAMIGAFKGRMLGFTAVVPNPEVRDRRLTRDFAQDLTRHSSEYASTLSGMEGYIGAVVTVEALKRANRRTGEGVADALRELRDFDLGGFVVSFDRNTGSTWVDIGVRSRDGNLLR